MAKNLIMLGLGLIVAWVLLRLVALLLDVALYAGALLVLIGIIWHAIARAERRS